MKLSKTLLLLFVSVLIISCKNEKSNADVVKIEEEIKISDVVKIIPIAHGTFILETDTAVIYIDPTGGKEAFEGQKDPTVVLITDIHSDHLSTSTLETLAIENSTVVVPKAVADKIPTAIVDIIRQHHGTSLVIYFYHKAQNYNDGVDYPEEKFRYQGPKPQTKEAAIVMLSDCVEAFVRSLSEKDRNLEKIRWIIGEITRQKFEDGQLDECPLQVAELRIIGEAFMQVYNGLYHERIAYPEKG